MHSHRCINQFQAITTSKPLNKASAQKNSKKLVNLKQNATQANTINNINNSSTSQLNQNIKTFHNKSSPKTEVLNLQQSQTLTLMSSQYSNKIPLKKNDQGSAFKNQSYMKSGQGVKKNFEIGNFTYYEDRSRQNTSNVLNQSYSESNAYEQNQQSNQLVEGFESNNLYSTRNIDNTNYQDQFKQIDDESIIQDHLDLLIQTSQHETLTQNLNNFCNVPLEQEAQLQPQILSKISGQNLSKSTDKLKIKDFIVQSQLMNNAYQQVNDNQSDYMRNSYDLLSIKHNQSCISQGNNRTLSQQRRSRTQRKIMRELSLGNLQSHNQLELVENQKRLDELINDEVTPKVMEIVPTQEIQTPFINSPQEGLQNSTHFLRVNEVQTVDDFAKSLINNDFALPSSRKVSSVSNLDLVNEEKLSQNQNYAGNFQDSGKIHKIKVQSSQVQNPADVIVNQQNAIQNEPPQLVLNNISQQALQEQEHVKHFNESQQIQYKQDPIESPHITQQQQVQSTQVSSNLYAGQSNNLNEDINHLEMAQLYGQISMFDQLTDYNEVDNETDQQYSPDKSKYKRRERISVEDDEGEDRGEDDDVQSNDLREFRHRLQDINEDIQSYMDGGEDCELNQPIKGNKVHNLQVNTQHDNSNLMLFQENDEENMDQQSQHSLNFNNLNDSKSSHQEENHQFINQVQIFAQDEEDDEEAQVVISTQDNLNFDHNLHQDILQNDYNANENRVNQLEDQIGYDFDVNQMLQNQPMNQQSITQETEIILQQQKQLQSMNEVIKNLQQLLGNQQDQINFLQQSHENKDSQISQFKKEKELLQTIIESKKLNENSLTEQLNAKEFECESLKSENGSLLMANQMLGEKNEFLPQESIKLGRQQQFYLRNHEILVKPGKFALII
eukprot:403371453